MIEICDIHKRYGSPREELVVLNGASAAIKTGTFAAVCGPSGAGKSTLLLILGGLLRPDQGCARIDGEDFFSLSRERRAWRRARTIGFVFQRFHLLPYLTVEENIRLATIGLRGADEPDRATRLMERFGIAGRRRHVPGALSVGEQQRTALARALYNRPAVLLADEPTGNLDPENSRVVLRAFADFAGQGGTVVMATHRPEAAAHAHQRWWIRDAQLVEE